MAILGNINRTATLRAKGDAELLVIRGKDFSEVLAANPGIAIRLLGLLVRRLAK
jgi:CRP-like cAMP-binding protein